MQNTTAKKLINLSDAYLGNLREISEKTNLEEMPSEILAKVKTVKHVLMYTEKSEISKNVLFDLSYILNDVEAGIKALDDLSLQVLNYLFAVKNPQELIEAPEA